ncbi:hypothetical protein BDK92_6897 [Micromonospora pisi]|uniref:Uncharacterized protein n=1 Tax=Micromonospora pisi TaxID=589240 RepID=A0A495JTY1_9ACTN|nr:hypothetical protein BDK92_6897 [Micromonospora pisi]
MGLAMRRRMSYSCVRWSVWTEGKGLDRKPSRGVRKL